MRLGKEKAAGYVEDTEACAPAEAPVPDPERAQAAPEPERAVAAG
ncbi:MAG TPA: hypothetical protein VKV38_05345 [Trebonia sp.]|jgi:hypothetical protein|nr:hypothetical protein [Trebonia sp.]